jgi:N-methylhydantoinase B
MFRSITTDLSSLNWGRKMLDKPTLAAGLDAARFEIVKNALLSAAEEMKIVLAKTAYSPVLKLAGDYSCGIFDRQGNMVAQGPDLPVHLGSMPDSVKAVLKTFPVADEGDVYIHNDPYQGGSHLPDVNVVLPAFYKGTHLGYCCVRAHWPDVGSATPGSYGAVTEIFGEGLRMPATRIYVNGEPDLNVEALIMANVRAPSERLGDLRAQVASNRRAVTRLQGLAEKYGIEQLVAVMDGILDYSETMMRAALRRIPDGISIHTDTIDGDGILEAGATEDAQFRVRMKITKKDDSVEIDFEGSDPRVAGPMNAPLTVTRSGVYAALKVILDPGNQIPPNSGAWRPFLVTAPVGCVVNAQEPAAVTYANHEMFSRIADMTFTAMFAMTPQQTIAGSHSTGGVVIFGGTDYRNGQTFVSYEITRGGHGARPTKDGINAVSNPVGNMLNTPVEMLEMSFPLRVEEFCLLPDTGGAGKWRGGLGAKRVWRVLKNDTHCATCAERTMTPPNGLAGGLDGAASELILELADGTVRPLLGKGAFIAPAESQIVFKVAGSGGYGNPMERDPVSIRRDIDWGYVTPEAAARDYGMDWELRTTRVAAE